MKMKQLLLKVRDRKKMKPGNVSKEKTTRPTAGQLRVCLFVLALTCIY